MSSFISNFLRIGTKQFFVNLPYGDEWRIHRRMFQQYFAPKNLPCLQEKMIYFVRHALLPNLYQNPKKYRDHVHGRVLYLFHICNTECLPGALAASRYQ
jgi:hypothetical protein